ncbi:MAG: hypothetical protein HY551_07040 [Elusimicrobia bacterium]|nr:hypothetical protein [Elusimicrobiota bacterium]
MKAARRAWTRIEDLFMGEDDPDEPYYDPIHIGGAIVITLTAVGCLYWLLWTLLVYEGGIFQKAYALAELLWTSKTLSDLGYKGYPYALGAFEGTLGNVGALGLCILAIAALGRLYRRAAGRGCTSLPAAPGEYPPPGAAGRGCTSLPVAPGEYPPPGAAAQRHGKRPPKS